MTTDSRDTIFALASARGRAGVAVVRISGPRAVDMLRTMGAALPQPRRATLRRLHTADGQVFDQALVFWFPAPHSFTGEDVVELHLHGGPAILDAATATLISQGAAPAEPGAFSRRAFEHGKLDLTQAEAIADLVDAETAAQRDQALRQLDGDLSALYEGWRQRLIEIMARIEGEIDFPDEGDVPDGLAARAAPDISELAEAMRTHLDDSHRGERVRDGFHIAIVGPPNAGKSTLFNALLQRDAAIVTNVPGTTRDIVEGRLVIAGFPVILADTAGLRDTKDVVEREGVARAMARAEDADLRIIVWDGADTDRAGPGWPAIAPMVQPGDLVLRNKCDAKQADAQPSQAPKAALAVSATTGQGLDHVRAHLERHIGDRLAATEAPSLTRARHRVAVTDAAAALDLAIARLADAPELAGEDVRLAARALATITGRVDVDDILDRVFADFCIGK